MNIIKKLDDLIQQATHERSRCYMARVLAEAKFNLERERQWCKESEETATRLEASLAESERALGEALGALRDLLVCSMAISCVDCEINCSTDNDGKDTPQAKAMIILDSANIEYPKPKSKFIRAEPTDPFFAALEKGRNQTQGE